MHLPLKALISAIILGATLASFAQQAAAAEPSSVKPPNVVIILADDLGYSDLGIQGGKDIPTPNIDQLARKSTRFTSGYVTCPVCAPTRAALLTGRYQQRYGFDENGSIAQIPNYGLERSEKTIADSFKAAGYATAAFGKWHLGEGEGFQPNDRGFDEFFGFLAGANDYIPYDDLEANAKTWRTAGAISVSREGTSKGQLPKTLTDGRRFPIYRQKTRIVEPRYLTEAFAQESVNFIDRQTAAGKPFFLYLPFNAVHVPFSSTEKYDSRFPNLPPGRKDYAALLSAMDDAVGAVVAKLREKGIENDTLIFFLSDNGGPSIDNGGPKAGGSGGSNYSTNLPLRGRKNTFYEGGFRVPFFVSWAGHLPADKVIDTPVVSLDILPTALAAAGIKHAGDKPLDGKNILPLIQGQDATPPHDHLFWRVQNRFAARDSQWKTIRFEDGRVELYDLTNDISESNNVADKHPEIVQRLQTSIENWNATLEKPRWNSSNKPSAAPQKTN